jgi:hypothetical protein
MTAKRLMASSSALDSAVLSESHATVSADILIDPPCRRIRIGTAGDLAIEYPDGSQDIIPALLDAESVEVQASKILDVGTTAAKITIFW